MYLHVQKWAVKLVLFRGCLARYRKSPERGNVTNQFSGKEVDFARSLLDKQHEFNGTSLEVNKIRQSFIWVVTLNRNLHKVVYKKLEK